MHDSRDGTSPPQSNDDRAVHSRGSGTRRSIRGVAVAPQRTAASGSPRRGSSVLRNIRDRAIPFPAISSHGPIARDNNNNNASHADECLRVSPTRSEPRRSGTSSFSRVIRGPTEASRMLDSLALLRQDSDNNAIDRDAATKSAGPDHRSLPRQGTYVLRNARDAAAKSHFLWDAGKSRRHTMTPAFREMPVVDPKAPETPEDGPTDNQLPEENIPPTRTRQAFLLPRSQPAQAQPHHQVIGFTLFGYAVPSLYELWERLQVSHCGRYSIERMLALDEYCHRSSVTRVLAVCLLFPLAPLLVIVLIECIPLQSPEKGPIANYVFWIRNATEISITITFGTRLAKAWIPELALTMRQILMIATATAVILTTLKILVAELWVFPIPFLLILGAPFLLMIWAITTRVVLGPHPVEGVQDGEFRGRHCLLLISVQVSLVLIYQSYQAVFLSVAGVYQVGMILLLPLVNLALKNLQMAWGSHLEDNLPEVVIFSVDVFSAIYSVLCMHSANSIRMVLLTLGLNTSVMVLSLYGMSHRSKIARDCRSFQQMQRQQRQLRRSQSVLEAVVTGGGSPELLNTLVATTLRLLQSPGQLDSTELQSIRLLSGMQHKLSEANSALLNSLAARCVYNNNRRSSEVASMSQLKSRYSSKAMVQRTLSFSRFVTTSPPPPRSKLAQRLRGAVLVIPATNRLLSMRSNSRDFGNPSRSGSRGDDSTHTASSESELEHGSRPPSSVTPQSSTKTLLAANASAPRISHLVKSSSKSARLTTPELWKETSEKLLPLFRTSKPVIGNVVEETRKQNTRAVQQTLQLLFNNEYLGLVAYTQCIIPVLYLCYMPVLHAVPNRVYYPTHYRYFGSGKEFQERMTVIGILAMLQLVVFVALQVFVVKRFAVSTIYQVAFVLESNFTLLQGRLLVWLFFAVQSTLVHYGADFTFQFDWIRHDKSDVVGGESPPPIVVQQVNSIPLVLGIFVASDAMPRKRGVIVPHTPVFLQSRQEVPPPPPHERRQSRIVDGTLKVVENSIGPLYNMWERLQVSHCGQYSVERMLALEEYGQRVSPLRVVVVCALTPLSPLILVVLVAWLPLRATVEGPDANYMFWIRHSVVMLLTMLSITMQAKAWLSELPLTTRRIFGISLTTAAVTTVSDAYIAKLWVFPVPFMNMVQSPVFIGTGILATRLVLGKEVLRGIPDVEFRLRRYFLLMITQFSLVTLYPAYQALFAAMPIRAQPYLIALLTLVNIGTKNVLAACGAHLEDRLPEVIVFTVDVFNSLYSVLCMRSTKSLKMVAVVVTLNVLDMMLALHGMHRRSRVALANRTIQQKRHKLQRQHHRQQTRSHSEVVNDMHEDSLGTLFQAALKLLQSPGQLDPAELRQICLLSCAEHNVSETNKTLLAELAARCVYNNERRPTALHSLRERRSRYSSAAMSGPDLNAEYFAAALKPRSRFAERVRDAVRLIPEAGKRLSLQIGARLNVLGFRVDSRDRLSQQNDIEESDSDSFETELASDELSEMASPSSRRESRQAGSGSTTPKSPAHMDSFSRKTSDQLEGARRVSGQVEPFSRRISRQQGSSRRISPQVSSNRVFTPVESARRISTQIGPSRKASAQSEPSIESTSSTRDLSGRKLPDYHLGSSRRLAELTAVSTKLATSLKLRPLLFPENAIINDVLKETRKQNTVAVNQTLQLLFNNEYLGLIAYAQCITPTIYMLYMVAIQELPNRSYYMRGGDLDNPDKLTQRFSVIAAFVCLQATILLGLHIFVAVRFGVSTLYQVAFVLETHARLVQAKIATWLLFAVGFTLEHYGVDFTFQFEWMERPPDHSLPSFDEGE